MGTPHFAPSAKFQLILQVFPTEVCKGFASKCPGGQIDLYKTGHINRIQSFNPSLFFKKKGGFQDRIQSFNPSLFLKKKGVFRILITFEMDFGRFVCCGVSPNQTPTGESTLSPPRMPTPARGPQTTPPDEGPADHHDNPPSAAAPHSAPTPAPCRA
jgi:hypothetical protein